MKTKYIAFVLLFVASFQLINAQQPNDQKLTSEQVMEMSYEQLLSMPFEDLIKLADIVGVSTDQLLEMILNKELTTASKKRETAFESPLSSSVVTAEEIERAGVTTIEEALRLVPGMIIREKTNGVYDVHLRGFDNLPSQNFEHFAENSISLVMIDGSPVYNNVSGGTFWETLPVSINQIERIEVVRGASSALYGPNAASGVVNIITKTSAKKKINADVTARAGSDGTYMADIFLSSKVTNKLKVTAAANIDYRNRFDDNFYSFRDGSYTPMTDSFKNMLGRAYQGYQYQSLAYNRAKEVSRGNVNLIYEAASDVQFKLSGGLQDSKIQTPFFENLTAPFSVRSSKTGFGNFQANVKGFSANVYYQNGVQDLCEGMVSPVIKYDMSNLFANLEYNIDLGKLSIRPGFNYQRATYDDSKYVTEIRAQRPDLTKDPIIAGLFGGEQSTELYAGSLRADYAPFEKLRIVAAVRGDKYTDIDKIYYSSQFAVNYKINSNNLIRAVYSRAYRGAFVGDLHSNFKNELYANQQMPFTNAQMTQFKAGLSANPLTAGFVPFVQNPGYTFNYNQYYIGSNVANYDLKLMGMDLFELGYRSVLSDKIQLDAEAFYSKSKNFDVLVANGLKTSYTKGTLTVADFIPAQVKQTLSPAQVAALQATSTPFPNTVTVDDSLVYRNLPLTAAQYGLTGTVNFVVSKQVQIKVFGTWQETKLEKHITIEKDTVNITHKNTPSFYGGLSVNYMPISKLDLYLGSYFYSSQTYSRYYAVTGNAATDAALKANSQTTVNGKMILNLRVAYQVYKKNKIFVETKNIMFDDSREFGFADPIKSMIIGGVSLNF